MNDIQRGGGQVALQPKRRYTVRMGKGAQGTWSVTHGKWCARQYKAVTGLVKCAKVARSAEKLLYTVTRKGNAPHIWKVATIGFLYHGSDRTFCLGIKSKPVEQM